jgi:Ca2+-transporting ATPase
MSLMEEAARPSTPPTHWYRLSADDVAERLEVDPARGLSGAEARSRAAELGPNRLAEAPRRPAWLRFVDQFRNVLVYILVGAAVLSAAVGDMKDPIVILVVLLVNAVLGYVQESRADDAMAALASMLELTVRVQRDGEVQEVPAAELVPGDVVLLEAGDRVPADGRLLLASNLAVEEATLTGESVPSEKHADALAPDGAAEPPLGDRDNCAFMNTTVVRGRAEMLVTEIGMSTQVGRLAGLLSEAEDSETPLQRQLDVLGRRLALIAGVAVLAVFALAMAQGEPFADAALEAVALAVAAIPEGLPAVVTVTLAIGVSRMAERNAIVKRLASVETLGSTTAICSDKTGTLTLNQMTVTRAVVAGTEVQVDGRGYSAEGELRDGATGEPLGADGVATVLPALRLGLLCNDAHLRDTDDGTELVGDPTEGALVVLARKAGLEPDAERARLARTAEVPFDSATKVMATLHPDPDDPAAAVLAVKGAPDVVLARCGEVREGTGVVALDASRRGELAARNEELGSLGLRVLAVASRRLPVRAAEYEGELSEELDGLTLEALVGILDPARPEAVEAIRTCHHAGVAVRMITGDHASTAGAIARELGIEGEVVSGAELDAMSDDELAARIESIGVCARVSPEHKVRVVKALQSNGEVTAMTGDGVNDAPALKQAEIGVAMGITGTEVTKEAGDMVLTDDNFATIVAAVERGRAIYDNILHFVRFQLTTNVAAIGSILGARLLGLPMPFNPIQVLFVNIIADGPPAMSLGVDPPKPGLMERSPRATDERILSGERLARILWAAALMTAVVLGLLATQRESAGVEVAATMAFTAFVFLQLANALSVRAGEGTVFSSYSLTNRVLWLALFAVAGVQVAVVQLPLLQGLFGTVGLDAAQWGICVGVAVAYLLAEELRRLVRRAIDRRGARSDPASAAGGLHGTTGP